MLAFAHRVSPNLSDFFHPTFTVTSTLRSAPGPSRDEADAGVPRPRVRPGSARAGPRNIIFPLLRGGASDTLFCWVSPNEMDHPCGIFRGLNFLDYLNVPCIIVWGISAHLVQRHKGFVWGGGRGYWSRCRHPTADPYSPIPQSSTPSSPLLPAAPASFFDHLVALDDIKLGPDLVWFVRYTSQRVGKVPLPSVEPLLWMHIYFF